MKMTIKKTSLITLILCILVQSTIIPGNDSYTCKSAQISLAPDFTLQDTQGKTHRLSDYRSRPVLLDFTASWCGPCVSAAPSLDKVAKKYKDKIDVLSIDLQEELDVVINFKENTGAFWPYLLDKDSAVASSFNVTGIPHFVLVNTEGVIVSTLTGYNDNLFEKLSTEIDNNLGLPNVTKVKLKWKWEPYIGSITTNLILDNGFIYAGSSNGKMYCIKESDRTKVWEYQTGYPLFDSPVIKNGKVYIGAADMKLYCLDVFTGAKVWDYQTGGGNHSPAISNGKVYFGSADKNLYCLDAVTGAKVWEYETGGGIHSSPAISNGKVYFGSYDRKLYCLDATTGAKFWEYMTVDRVGVSPSISNDKVYFGSADKNLYCLDAVTGAKVWDYQTGGGIPRPPAILNDKVYFGSDDRKFYCLDGATGAKVWDYQTIIGISGSPVILNGKVYFGSHESKLYCLDNATGTKVWEYETSKAISNFPTISNTKIYFGTQDSMLYSLDATTGAKLWEYQTGGVNHSSPTFSNGNVFFGSTDSKQYCLDGATGGKVWEFQAGGWITSSSVYSKGKIFFGSDDGKLYCLDAPSGAKVWEFQTGAVVSSSPAISNSKVYFGSGNNKLYCLDETTGTKIWEYETGGVIESSPTFSNEKVFFGLTDSKLYCLDAKTGTKVWEFQTGAVVSSSPSISNAKVYFGSEDGKLYCLDETTGTKLWEYETGGPILSSPTNSYGKVYFGSNDSKLYCLDAATGTSVWEHNTQGNQSDLTINNSRVYFVTYFKLLFCLDAMTGAKLWEYEINDTFSSSPLISNGNVYLGSTNSILYCLDIGENEEITDDTDGPVITLVNPPYSGYKYYKPSFSYQVEVKVTDQSGVVEVLINGIPATPLYANGNHVATTGLNIGVNAFVVRAKDTKMNQTEMSFTIIVENPNEKDKIESVKVVVPPPTLTQNLDYAAWYVSQPDKKYLSFKDIEFTIPKLEGDIKNAIITKFATSTKPGSPDIPMFAIKVKIPKDEEYISMDPQLTEETIFLNGSFVTPTKSQFPLPAGGKPYVLPDPDEYDLKSVKPKPIFSKPSDSFLRPKRIHPAGGNPYKWPPELYSKQTNELVIFIKPAYYNKTDKSIKCLKEINLKINTQKKAQQLMSANQLKPAFLAIQEPYDMAIVSSGEFIGTEDGKMDDFADYAQWKETQGIRAKCIKISDIYAKYKSQPDNFKKLQAFLTDEAKLSGINYVLLGGENEIVPTSMVYAQADCSSGSYKALIPSDAYFTQSLADWGDVTIGNYKMIGKDKENIQFNPELFVGRVPVQTKDELKTFIGKMVKYTLYPHVQSYNQRIMLVGKKLDTDSYGGDFLDYEISGLPNIGQHYIKLYDRQPKSGSWEYLNYFNDDVVAGAISQRGPHLLAFNCHGSPTSLDSFGEASVDKINNVVPGYMMTSTSCNVNQFCDGVLFDANNVGKPVNADPCISEKLLFKGNGGALSYSGNSAYGWFCPGFPESSISSIYQKNFMTELLTLDENGKAQTIGEAFWKSKATCYGSTEDGIFDPFNWWTYSCYNLLGDPSFRPRLNIAKRPIDKLVLVPGISQIEKTSVFTLKAFSKGTEVRIDDPQNIEWILHPKDFGEISPLGTNCSVEKKAIGRKGVLFALYKGLQSFADVLPEQDRYKIKITPENAFIKLGKQIEFIATVIDSEGIDVPANFSIEWQVDKPEYGIINQYGLFTPKKAGKCKVMATCKSLEIGWWANVEITEKQF